MATRFSIPTEVVEEKKDEGKVYINLSFKLGEKKISLVLNTELTCQLNKGSNIQRALVKKLISLPDGKLPEKLLNSMEVEIFHTNGTSSSEISELEDLFNLDLNQVEIPGFLFYLIYIGDNYHEG